MNSRKPKYTNIMYISWWYYSITKETNEQDYRNSRLSPESIECFIEDQSFLVFVWFGSSPIPFHPSPLRKMSLFLFLRVPGRWGRGWRRSQIIRQRETLVLYKSFNTLWLLLPPPPFSSAPDQMQF